MPTTTAQLRANRPSRRTAKQDVLDQVASPATILRCLLTEHMLTQREVAEMVGVDERSVRRWVASHDSIKLQRRHAQILDDLRDLLGILGSTLPGEQFARWLRARNRYLGGARPMDVIAEGHYERVREAAEAYADGSYV